MWGDQTHLEESPRQEVLQRLLVQNGGPQDSITTQADEACL